MLGYFIIMVLFTSLLCLSEAKMQVCDLDEEEDVGEPLLLSPYLDSGKIDKARKASEVESLIGNVKSYSGFLTVNKFHDSNMFFWYFPAESFEEAPIILWLQGGPGTSSLVGLFLEHGPYNFENGILNLRYYSWTKKFHMIYVDNPVGTGFSYTLPSGMCQNETCIGKNLYNFLTQFYKMFPNLKWNDFYIAGQSYGCKYVAALAYLIHTKDYSNTEMINLKGIIIGSGLCDPVNMIDTSDYLYQVGLLDENAKRIYDQVTNEIIENINNQNWSRAFDLAYDLISTDPSNKSFFHKVTGFSSCFNLQNSNIDPSGNHWKRFIQDEYTRRTIHVGNREFQQYCKVYQALKEDFMQSVSPWLGELAGYYKILLYSGQLDIIIPYTSTVNFIRKLQWVGSENYKIARRRIWKDKDGRVAGYVKVSSPNCSSGTLTEVMIRNAGHIVPSDQPEWTFEMINHFIYDLSPFKSNLDV